MTTKLGFCLTVLQLSFISFAAEHAQDAETFDLRKISCEELMAMPEEDQGYVLVLVFGYTAGDNKKPILSSASIEQQITAAHHQCANAPDGTVLDLVAISGGTESMAEDVDRSKEADAGARPTKSGVNDAVLTPLSDLNLRRKKIPPLLQSLKSAYDPVTDSGCDSLGERVAALNAVLGPDVNEPTNASKDEKSGLAVDTVAGVTGSLIPFRGIVRRVTGASKRELRVAAAYRRGSERRAFLKGLGEQLRCEWPAAPREANSVVN